MDEADGAAPAELIRTLSTDGGVAVRSLIGSNLIAEAMSRREMAPTAANALGRTLMGTVLIAVASSNSDDDDDPAAAEESVQVQLRGDGPLGSVMAISDARGRVRGTVDHPEVDLAHADGSPDVARAIGLGSLRVVRHRTGAREPYTGAVPLVSGEVAKDLTLYLSESEQIPSAMGLGVAMSNDESAVVAAGFLVQILPGAHDSEIDCVERNVRNMPRLSELALSRADAGEIVDMLLTGLGSRTQHPMRPIFYCPCTRERAHRTLSLLGREELSEMVADAATQEVRCHFCGRAYDFDTTEIAAMIPASS